uniref:Uncharacterized protein n=1 Tax=Ralstonia solanacearum TaxID=305 RepID=A0A0S4WCB4_RALSL|nr:protein of unknown function [Ralstonia solanacearum]
MWRMATAFWPPNNCSEVMMRASPTTVAGALTLGAAAGSASRGLCSRVAGRLRATMMCRRRVTVRPASCDSTVFMAMSWLAEGMGWQGSSEYLSL